MTPLRLYVSMKRLLDVSLNEQQDILQASPFLAPENRELAVAPDELYEGQLLVFFGVAFRGSDVVAFLESLTSDQLGV